MRAKVLKTFSYSPDGISMTTLLEGSIVEIRNDLAPGLIEARFLATVEGAPAPVSAPASRVEEPVLDFSLPVEGPPPDSAGKLHIRHMGRGRYAIYRDDERLTQVALDKDGANSALAEMINATNSENAEG